MQATSKTRGQRENINNRILRRLTSATNNLRWLFYSQKQTYIHIFLWASLIHYPMWYRYAGCYICKQNQGLNILFMEMSDQSPVVGSEFLSLEFGQCKWPHQIRYRCWGTLSCPFTFVASEDSLLSFMVPRLGAPLRSRPLFPRHLEAMNMRSVFMVSLPCFWTFWFLFFTCRFFFLIVGLNTLFVCFVKLIKSLFITVYLDFVEDVASICHL